jgi:hypothetical protein
MGVRRKLLKMSFIILVLRLVLDRTQQGLVENEARIGDAKSIQTSVRELHGSRHLKDIGADGRITLTWILKQLNMRALTELIRIWTESETRFYKRSTENYATISFSRTLPHEITYWLWRQIARWF